MSSGACSPGTAPMTADRRPARADQPDASCGRGSVSVAAVDGRPGRRRAAPRTARRPAPRTARPEPAARPRRTSGAADRDRQHCAPVAAGQPAGAVVNSGDVALAAGALREHADRPPSSQLSERGQQRGPVGGTRAEPVLADAGQHPAEGPAEHLRLDQERHARAAADRTAAGRPSPTMWLATTSVGTRSAGIRSPGPPMPAPGTTRAGAAPTPIQRPVSILRPPRAARRHRSAGRSTREAAPPARSSGLTRSPPARGGASASSRSSTASS